MCGICGFINLRSDQRPIDKNILSAMAESLRHRGPDEYGEYLNDDLAMAIRRLKIIDLNTGSQPIHNEDKSVWVVFNGEIYNFPELRAGLEKKGHHFYTRCDTEVIVHLYEDYGADFIRHLNGMFAIALWDERDKRFLLVRDRLGVKPVFYSIVDDFLVFGSEVKALLKYPQLNRRIDEAALAKYLIFEFIPAPGSIFKEIKKIPAGHFLILENGKINIRQYWDAPQPDGQNKFDEAALIAELKDKISAAVQRRLISDVPLGVFLSGGVDSSSIVAFMRKVGVDKIKTFSIGFDDPSFDESRYARFAAQVFATEHYEQILNPKAMLDLIPEITGIIDEPMADASIIPTYLLSKFTREQVTVALGGDGGDEFFVGYPTYQAHKLAGYYENIPAAIRLRMIEPLVRNLPVSFDNFSRDFLAKKFISGMGFPNPQRHFIWMGSFAPQELSSLFAAPMKEAIGKTELFGEVFDYQRKRQASDSLSNILYLDMKFYLQDDILTKTDRSSMACSLEARAPFLDYTLVELVSRLPSSVRMKGMGLKYLFKKALKGVLPEEILRRKKKGFGIPLAKWLCSELKPLALQLFSKGRIEKQGIFDSLYIDRLLQEHFAGKKDHRKKLWTLLVFQLWFDRYATNNL